MKITQEEIYEYLKTLSTTSDTATLRYFKICTTIKVGTDGWGNTIRLFCMGQITTIKLDI